MAAASPDVPDAADPDAAPAPRRWSVGRIAAVMVALAIALFWIWIFSGAPAKDNPDELDDAAYVSSLEARCQELRADLDELPAAFETDDADERAAVVTEANGLVAQFIADLEDGAPSEGDDAESMAGWIADWQTYLVDREDYATRLASDPEARLYLDESPLGDSVDKTIEIFAQVNGIPDCATPGDVG